ncbi:UDP-N-acetylglucosamine 2-epimerase [[Clostridium] fimetarium]|uniref:UDP-N-acetylglucosamine 2-epimerase (Non-hydrolysing)/GDP/UDP-N,N'-diacetylbacillosamine 2-epimerase (Hydrolysing) n=1 Tax=[Clostridium] fimetarium TaxID=99656 RepID=A0A1I0Q998_9FIRM|nr:UDP-N-acetylglucosamine 2-epimerase [[Clostridium] fimetarium]SEW23381.1 UDP-N-acetylglucosamine 2-epimerase (non-hydrolysing)/GDP/UDP-N,N'-diacetylbacillosamine 2-epimerase (hydrolysing) [[Clostridium] fimetarium]
MKKLCVVTGSRSEYGLLKPILKRIEQDKDLKLQIIATGMHLDYRCGLTYKEIENDAFHINEKIEMNLASDTAVGICKSMAIGMISLAEAYDRLKPDIIILLGDRYEIFAAASAAMISKIPIAHIHGGEITQGSYDDCMRHAISKMSYLHFTSTKEYRKRVIQLGEQPDRVYEVGALGIENIKEMTLLTQQELEETLNIQIKMPLALVTFHAATLEGNTAIMQFKPLLDALDYFTELSVIFTKSNTDTGGNIINELINQYTIKNSKKSVAFTSLGSLRYLSIMSHSSVVIGNSSSGIIEAPFLKVPTVDIGDRQKGRVKSSSVISSNNSVQDIIEAIEKALNYKADKKEIVTSYENEDTSYRIISAIKQALQEGIDLKKTFYDFR